MRRTYLPYKLTAIKLKHILVPKLRLGNPVDEAPASRNRKLELPAPNSQAGAWELAQLGRTQRRKRPPLLPPGGLIPAYVGERAEG
jgi:hypothetical protein